MVGAAQDSAASEPGPTAIETEAALLGGLLIDNHLVDRVVEIVSERDFAEPAHARIFCAIVAEVSAGRGANPVLLKPILESDPLFGADQLGIGYLAALTSSYLGVTIAIDAARQIADFARRRRFLALTRTAQASAADPEQDVAAAALMADEAAQLLIERSAGAAPVKASVAWKRASEKIRRMQAGEESPGIQLIGLSDFNEVSHGLHAGMLYLLGGRPAMGKTAKMLAIARRAAQRGHGVLIRSLEMPAEQLMFRLMADLLLERGSRLTFDDLTKGRVGIDDWRLLAEIEAEVAEWPLVIDDDPALVATQIGPMIRRHKRQFHARGHTLDLVLIDYLGLIRPASDNISREQQVSGISAAAKGAARANNLPIVMLTQLNRKVEERDDKRPKLSDLRDSGSLEQDADAVFFLYREEYYLAAVEPDPNDLSKHDAWRTEMSAARNVLEFYSAKHRHGATVRRRMLYFADRQAIRNGDHFRSDTPR